MLRYLLFIMMAFAGLVAPAGHAFAATGEYTVHACRYPDGGVATFTEASLSDANSFGWGRRGATPSSTSCANGGVMKVGNPGTDLNLNEWVFKVPQSARIKNFTIARNLNGHSAAVTSSDYFLIANDQPNLQSEVNYATGKLTPSGQVFQACTAPGAAVTGYPDCGALNGTYSFAPINPAGAHYLHVAEFCDRQDSPGASCSTSETVINRAAVTLADPNAPSGAITDDSDGAQNLAGPSLGNRTFKLTAADAESGLLYAELRVDGRTAVGPQKFDQATVECADKYSGAGGEGYDYNTPRPCPSAGSTTLAFNTSGLAVGRHTVEAVITDAAGNQTVLGRELTVPGPNTSQPEVYSYIVTDPPPACSNGRDDDGDAVADMQDPGCHTDGNPTNAATYNPSDNDESNAACSNGRDDDGDKQADSKDAGCHTDGNPANPNSYNPADPDETNPACSNGIDDDKDKKADSKDPGCHTDGDAGNPKTYNPGDPDETDPAPQQCKTVTAKFQPGKYERRYTTVSKSRRTAITRGKAAKRYSGKSKPRVRIRGKLTGVKGCVAYMHIAGSRRQVSKRTNNGLFTEFYFEGLKSGTVKFSAKNGSVKLHVKRR